MRNTCILYSTAADAATAGRIGRTLVEEGLAACVNIIPGMQSIYRWQGAIEQADEVVLLVKTTTDQAAAAGERLRRQHPYQEPCVLELPVSGGSASYLE